MKRLRDPENAAAVFVVVALVMIGLALLGGVFLGRATKETSTAAGSTTTTSSAPVDPKVAAGAHDFVNFACAQCHGLDGQGGVSPFVPALKNASKLTDAQLTHIINHGLGARIRESVSQITGPAASAARIGPPPPRRSVPLASACPSARKNAAKVA